mmetsp:Transcript_14880/g.25343  ORF Transcript_14880/g.25343 Transcript_14880/m.25343 type:complete len:149 (+) Transcript_14880:1850-2296(+)
MDKKRQEEEAARGGGTGQKPSLRAIIQYTEGGYFGDSDLFCQMVGISQDKGRDSTAICDQECTIFVMPYTEIIKIKEVFGDVYQEMLEIAVKRHKNHQILIAKEVKAYIQRAKMESEQSDSSELASDLLNDTNSLVSERMEETANKLL